MAKREEVTGEMIAEIAGRILRSLKFAAKHTNVLYHDFRLDGDVGLCTQDELKAVAASCLTQSPNRPKPAPRKGSKGR